MKCLSTEQNVHKSMNIVHDLATLTLMTFTLFRGACSDKISVVNIPTWPS